VDQTRPGELLPRGRRRHRPGAARAAVHAAPVPRGAGRREGPPEADPARGARRGCRPCGCTSPAGTAPPTSCASPSSDRSSGRCRCRPWSSIRGTSGAPMSIAPTSGGSTSTRCPRPGSTGCASSRGSSARCLTSWGSSVSRRLRAATGCTSTSGSCPSGSSATSAGRPSPSPARWSGGCRRRDDDLVAQGPRPPACLHRLQPERARPHHRGGLLGPRRPRRHRLDADPVGRDRRRGAPIPHARNGSREVCRPR
jgi:hypothetical protein